MKAMQKVHGFRQLIDLDTLLFSNHATTTHGVKLNKMGSCKDKDIW